jgi:hypothetical protein
VELGGTGRSGGSKERISITDPEISSSQRGVVAFVAAALGVHKRKGEALEVKAVV